MMTAYRDAPLARLREGPHVSVSQVKTYLLCPRKYEHAYILQTLPAHRPAALAFGSAVHHALAVFYEDIRDHGHRPDRDRLLAAFEDRLDVECSDAVPLRYDDDQDPSTLKDRGVALLSLFRDRGLVPDRVLSVEYPFSIPIPDPDIGVVLDEALLGAVDLVAEHQGRPLLVEHKTASRRLSSDRLQHDLQPTAYRFAARHLRLRDPALAFQTLLKSRQPGVEVTPIARTRDQEIEMLDTFAQVLCGIRAGVFPRNRGWPCAECPYEEGC